MISLNPASISNEEQAEIHPCPATVTTGDPGRETPLDRCQDPVSNYADTARSRGFPRLTLSLVYTGVARTCKKRDFVVDRTGHSRNKLDRYTVLQSCLEFNRDTISCASSPRPVHAIYRSVAWLFRWFITVPRDMSAGQFPRRSRGTFSLGRIYGFRRLCPRMRSTRLH